MRKDSFNSVFKRSTDYKYIYDVNIKTIFLGWWL